MISITRQTVGSMILFVLLGFAGFVSAWTNPASAPPNGNVSAPVNIGTTAQVKSGGLSLTALSVYGATLMQANTLYDVWLQGGASTAGGDARNLALLGGDEDSGDTLYLNYNGEYGGGTIIGGDLTVNGGINGALTPAYVAWSTYGTGAGGAAIYNDNGTHKKLMVVGNNSAGGAREVGIWDNLKVNGNVTAAGYFHSSDKRLKTNIQTAPGLSIVNKLRGVMFDWKKDNTPSSGLIAQEVEEVMPSAVHTDAEGMKSVEYDQLIAPLIEAVKEQQAEIESLKYEIDTLKASR